MGHVHEEPKGQMIMGRAFLEALGSAGIIRVEDHIRRVVIDAPVDEALQVYVERYGDDRLLEVVHHPDLRTVIKQALKV